VQQVRAHVAQGVLGALHGARKGADEARQPAQLESCMRRVDEGATGWHHSRAHAHFARVVEHRAWLRKDRVSPKILVERGQ
jgi:hypothetical protein